MNSIRGSSAWWSLAHMVRVGVTALDIQVSLRNSTAMLEDSMTSVKTLYWYKQVRDSQTEEILISLFWVKLFMWHTK